MTARRRRTLGDAEVLREARHRFTRCVEWESMTRQNQLNDIKFAEGDSYNCWQWDQTVRTDRGNRPSLTHNKVRQHNLMIVNDARQNKAQIKYTPTGDNATYEAAQVMQGLARRIEYQSKAVDAYSTAVWHQVQSGIGYVRIVTEYQDDDGFDQEIFIRRVNDPRTIYMDPDAQDYDKADMRYCFVFIDVPRDQFEGEYGRWDQPEPALDNTHDNWVTRDHVRIAEYWRRNEDEDWLHLMNNGAVLRESELGEDERDAVRRSSVQRRLTRESTVEWFKIVGNRIDEHNEWAGKYIPIVPCIGEETVIDGKMDRKGHTRSQIDAQRIYNYWASSAVEQVALQPKIPYIADVRAIESQEHYWRNANTHNYAVLPYNGVDDAGQPIPPPARSPAPEMSQAYIQGMMISRQDLLDVTGQYQAELGMPSNERSGVAIQQRQRQGDTATYHYIDNQAKMIRQVGRILLDLIPKIYDTTRAVKIMGFDDSEQDVVLAPNHRLCHQQVQMTPMGPQPVTADQQEQMRRGQKLQGICTIFNPSMGRYDVEADVGPSFGTQRQEAANAFAQIMMQNPQAFQVVGDFWAENSDFPGAEELADRLRRGLPPQYAPGPSPQVMQLQQALQQTTQTAQQTLQTADAHIATLNAEVVRLREELDDKRQQTLINDYKAETDRLKAVGAIDPMSLQIIVRQMVQDMLRTDLVPTLHQHAAVQASLQDMMTPPTPVDGDQGGNGGGGNGGGPAPSAAATRSLPPSPGASPGGLPGL